MALASHDRVRFLVRDFQIAYDVPTRKPVQGSIGRSLRERDSELLGSARECLQKSEERAAIFINLSRKLYARITED